MWPTYVSEKFEGVFITSGSYQNDRAIKAPSIIDESFYSKKELSKVISDLENKGYQIQEEEFNGYLY